MSDSPATRPAGPAGGQRADFGPYQMADHLGASHSQIDGARELGLLPRLDAGGTRWSAAAVSQISGRWPGIAAAIEVARELGAARCAALLAGLTGLAAEAADVGELAARGLIEASGCYKDRPLYRDGHRPTPGRRLAKCPGRGARPANTLTRARPGGAARGRADAVPLSGCTPTCGRSRPGRR